MPVGRLARYFRPEGRLGVRVVRIVGVLLVRLMMANGGARRSASLPWLAM